MPSVSKKQHNAMEAAAHGNSTIGIPKKVAQEFVAADKKQTSYEDRSRAFAPSSSKPKAKGKPKNEIPS